MPLLTPHVPNGLIDLMKDLAKEVLRDKPENICEFAVNHFEQLILERDGSLDKGYEEFSAFEAYFDGHQRFAVPANYGYICQKPIKIQPIPQPRKSKSDIMASFQAMESINEEDVLAPAAVPEGASLYADEKYQNAIYVIQRYFRRYMARIKKNPPSNESESLSAFTAAIIIQRTMRRLFSNKIKLKQYKESDPSCSSSSVTAVKLVHDDMDNVSEAASYTSSSTIQMLADGQEGRENRLASGQSRRQQQQREEVLDGYDGDGGSVVGATDFSSMEFKEPPHDEEPPSSSATAAVMVVADDDDEEHSHSHTVVAAAVTEMDRKSIADENGNTAPTPEEKPNDPSEPTTTDDTSTAHNIGILSTKIGNNYNHQNLPNTRNHIEEEIDRNKINTSEPTQINTSHLNIIPAGLSVPLNYSKSLLGATPDSDTLPATSPHLKGTQETFAVHHHHQHHRLEEYANENGKNNDATSFIQGDGRIRKFDSDNGESLKIYDVYYHDVNDQEFSDSLNESTMEKDSLEPEDLDADSLESNENVVHHHMSEIIKRDAKQDDGSLYGDKNDDDDEEGDEDNNDNAQNVQKFVEIERVPTYLYGIHPARTPIVERRHRNRNSEEDHKVPEDKKYLEAVDSSSELYSSKSPEEKSEEESLESKGSTSGESSATQIENSLELTGKQNKARSVEVKPDKDKEEPTKCHVTVDKSFNDSHSNSSTAEGKLSMDQKETTYPTPENDNHDLKTKEGSENAMSTTINPNTQLSKENLADSVEDSEDRNVTNLLGHGKENDTSKNNDFKLEEDTQNNKKPNQKANDLSPKKPEDSSSSKEKTTNLEAKLMIPQENNGGLEENLRSNDLGKQNLKENSLLVSAKIASKNLIASESGVSINSNEDTTTSFQEAIDNINSALVNVSASADKAIPEKAQMDDMISLKLNESRSDFDVKKSRDEIETRPSKNEDDEALNDQAMLQVCSEQISLGKDKHLSGDNDRSIEPVERTEVLVEHGEANFYIEEKPQALDNADLFKDEILKQSEKLNKLDENICEGDKNDKEYLSNISKSNMEDISKIPSYSQPDLNLNSETSDSGKKKPLDHDDEIESQLRELQNLNDVNPDLNIEDIASESHLRKKRSVDAKNQKMYQHDDNNKLEDSFNQDKDLNSNKLNTTGKSKDCEESWIEEDEKLSKDKTVSKGLMNGENVLASSKVADDEKPTFDYSLSSKISESSGKTTKEGEVQLPTEDCSPKEFDESHTVGVEAGSDSFEHSQEIAENDNSTFDASQNSKISESAGKTTKEVEVQPPKEFDESHTVGIEADGDSLEHSQGISEQKNAFSDRKSEDQLEIILNNEQGSSKEEKLKISNIGFASPKETSSVSQIPKDLKILSSTSGEHTKLLTGEESLTNSDLEKTKVIQENSLSVDQEVPETVNESLSSPVNFRSPEKSISHASHDEHDFALGSNGSKVGGNLINLEEKSSMESKITTEDEVIREATTINEDKTRILLEMDANEQRLILEAKDVEEVKDKIHEETKTSKDDLKDKDIKSFESKNLQVSEKRSHSEKEEDNDKMTRERSSNEYPAENIKQEEESIETLDISASDTKEEATDIALITEKSKSIQNLKNSQSTEEKEKQSKLNQEITKSSDRFEEILSKNMTPTNIEDSKISKKVIALAPEKVESEHLKEANPDSELINTRSIDNLDVRVDENVNSITKISVDVDSKDLKNGKLCEEVISKKMKGIVEDKKLIQEELSLKIRPIEASLENINKSVQETKAVNENERTINDSNGSEKKIDLVTENPLQNPASNENISPFKTADHEDSIPTKSPYIEGSDGSSAATSADFSSIGKDLDFFEDTIKYLKNAMEHLGGMEDMLDTKKKSIDISKDINVLNIAALLIQSAFRGYKVRKVLGKTSQRKCEAEHILNKRSLDKKDIDSKSNDEKKTNAAIKIQSGYRGHRVRKNLKETLNKEESEVQSTGNVASSTKEDKLLIQSPSKNVLGSNVVKSQIPVAVIHPIKYSSVEESKSEKLSESRTTKVEGNAVPASSPSKQLRSSQTSVKTNPKNVKTSPQKTAISTRQKPSEKKPNIKSDSSNEFKEGPSTVQKRSTEKNDQTFILDNLDQTVKLDQTKLGNRKLTTVKSKNLKTKTQSTADLLERPKGSKKITEKFERQGKSVSINRRTQNQESFDLEKIKKELLSTTFKSPPQSGSKKKTRARIRSGKQRSPGKLSKGTKIPQKSPSKVIGKQPSLTELLSGENTGIDKHVSMEDNSNRHESDLSKTFTKSMDENTNLDLNLDTDKNEVNNNTKKKTLNKTYTIRSALNEFEDHYAQLKTSENKSENNSEDLFDSLKKDVDKLKANIHEKSAVTIQKTFRGFKTRKEFNRGFKRSTTGAFNNGNLRAATAAQENVIEASSTKGEQNSSENQEITKDSIPKEIQNVKDDKVRVSEKEGSMTVEKLADPILNKAATNIQKTYRGYKTRKNYRTNNEQISKPEKNEDSSNNLRLEPEKLLNENNIQQVDKIPIEESTNRDLEKSALKIQKTFRGYQSRKQLKSKKNSKIVKTEGRKEEQELGKMDAKSKTQTDESEESSTSIFEDLQKSFEGYKNLVLDKSATTIQKHFRGYKIRKDIHTKGFRSGIANGTNVLDMKAQVNGAKNEDNSGMHEKSKHSLKELGENDSTLSKLEEPLEDAFNTRPGEEFKIDKLGFEDDFTGSRNIEVDKEENGKTIDTQHLFEKRDIKAEGQPPPGELEISGLSKSALKIKTEPILTEDEFKKETETVSQGSPTDLDKSVTIIQKNFRGYKTRQNLKRNAMITNLGTKPMDGKTEEVTEKSDKNDTQKQGIFDSFDVEEFHNEALKKSATTIQKTFRGYKTRKDLRSRNDPTKLKEEKEDISRNNEEVEGNILNMENLTHAPTEDHVDASYSNKESVKSPDKGKAESEENLDKTIIQTGNLSFVQLTAEDHTSTSKESLNSNHIDISSDITSSEGVLNHSECNSTKGATKASSAGAVLENAASTIQKAYRDYYHAKTNHNLSTKSYNGTQRDTTTPKEVLETSDESSTFIGPDTSFDLSDVESVETKSEKAFNHDKINSSEAYTPTNNSENALASTFSITLHSENREIDNESITTPQKLRHKRSFVEPTAPPLDEILKAEESSVDSASSPKLKWFVGDEPIIPSDSSSSKSSSSPPCSSSTVDPLISTFSKFNDLSSSIDACDENLNSNQQLTPSINSAVVSTSSLLFTNNNQINNKNTLNNNSGIVSANEEEILKKEDNSSEKIDQNEEISKKLEHEDGIVSSVVKSKEKLLADKSELGTTEAANSQKNTEDKQEDNEEVTTDLCKNCAEGIHAGGICSEDLIKTSKSDKAESDLSDEIKQFVLMEDLKHAESPGGDTEASVIPSQKEESSTLPSSELDSSNVAITASDVKSQGPKNEVPTDQLKSLNDCPAISLIPPSSEDDTSERESSLEVQAQHVDDNFKNEKSEKTQSEDITNIRKEDTEITLEKSKEKEMVETEAGKKSVDAGSHTLTETKTEGNISVNSFNEDLMVDSNDDKKTFPEETISSTIKEAHKKGNETVEISKEEVLSDQLFETKSVENSDKKERSQNSLNEIEEKACSSLKLEESLEDAFKTQHGNKFKIEKHGFEDNFNDRKNIEEDSEEKQTSTQMEEKSLSLEESKTNTHIKKEESLETNTNEGTSKDLENDKEKTVEENGAVLYEKSKFIKDLEIKQTAKKIVEENEKSSDQIIEKEFLENTTENQTSKTPELKKLENDAKEGTKFDEFTASEQQEEIIKEEQDEEFKYSQRDETETKQITYSLQDISSSLKDKSSTKAEDSKVKTEVPKEDFEGTSEVTETKVTHEKENNVTSTLTKEEKDHAQLEEDMEIAAKLIESSLSDPQAKLLENENKGKQVNKELSTTINQNNLDPEESSKANKEAHSENQHQPDPQVESKLEKLIEDNLKPAENIKNTVDLKDLPTENSSQEVVEEPCVKKVIPPTPYSASSDPDESEIESTTTKVESTTTTPGYDETSETDALDIPPSKPDVLDAMTEKLREPEEMVARMRQRRASEHKISIDSLTDQQAVFEEPICEPIKPMQQIQKSSSTEVEDEFVLQKLQRSDTTRESSAQSESVVYGDSTSQLTESEDTFNENLDHHSLHRMNTIASNRNTFKHPNHLFKSVTIDDTVKYIDPEKSTEESGSSFCMDDVLSEDVRKKMMAYSVSEADSDYYDLGDQTNHPHDDFNISTALDNFPSTDTDTTIVSAATKIQAGARGFLTRRRIRRASMGTKASLTEERKLSFGNDAIGESLDQLAEEENGRRQFNRQTGVNSLPSALEHSDEILSPLGGGGKDIQIATTTPAKHSSIKIEGEEANKIVTSSEYDVNDWLEKPSAEEDDSSQVVSNLEATVARRLTLQRGDALRNDSTPDDENGNGKQVELAKNNQPSAMGAVLVHEKTMVESTTTTTTRTTTERRNYSDAAVSNKKEKIKWFALRQNSMPVQIDSEVFRVMPKHMRKRIKSAEGEKPKRIRLPRD